MRVDAKELDEKKSNIHGVKLLQLRIKSAEYFSYVNASVDVRPLPNACFSVSVQ